jgi:NAD(P)-dependent dehydrogenase (short-subunit alcohol dehydrogenase family)
LTQDGLEFTFALNHMAYFVLTEGLRERLLASGPARIINTASAAHQDATLDFADLQSAKNFGAIKAYSRSKLCNILFTRELARRLHGTGVTANCLHPGFVATRFGDESGGPISRLLWLAKFFAITPAKGAETIVYLASSPDVATTTGQYYDKRETTFTYKGRGADARQTGRELEVRYLLEGSIVLEGERVRVNARLVETAEGSQVWSERFDTERKSILQVQDEIVGRVSRAIGL